MKVNSDNPVVKQRFLRKFVAVQSLKKCLPEEEVAAVNGNRERENKITDPSNLGFKSQSSAVSYWIKETESGLEATVQNINRHSAKTTVISHIEEQMNTRCN